MIKYFLAQVDKVPRDNMLLSSTQGNCKTFQENLRGIVFYAVPHSGSSQDFAKYMKFCRNLQTPNLFFDLPHVFFPEFTKQMEKLDFEFRYSIKGDTIIMAIVEGRPMGQEVQFHNSMHLIYTNNTLTDDFINPFASIKVTP